MRNFSRYSAQMNINWRGLILTSFNIFMTCSVSNSEKFLPCITENSSKENREILRHTLYFEISMVIENRG